MRNAPSTGPAPQSASTGSSVMPVGRGSRVGIGSTTSKGRPSERTPSLISVTVVEAGSTAGTRNAAAEGTTWSAAPLAAPVSTTVPEGSVPPVTATATASPGIAIGGVARTGVAVLTT